jgi:hypothetical protein
MEEIKCEQVGQIEKQGLNEMTGRVYGVNGLSPSIRTFCGGGARNQNIGRATCLRRTKRIFKERWNCGNDYNGRK